MVGNRNERQQDCSVKGGKEHGLSQPYPCCRGQSEGGIPYRPWCAHWLFGSDHGECERRDRVSEKGCREPVSAVVFESSPPKTPGFAGKWEGFWDDKKDYRFTLTIANVNSEIADVKYESKDLQFFEKAEFIPGEKPRIEWMINSIVKPEGPFASPTAAGTKEYYAILIESIPIYYSFEIQKDGTLKGTFDSKRMSKLGTSRTAVMKRVN